MTYPRNVRTIEGKKHVRTAPVTSECFNLPIRILINVQVIKPREAEHAPLKERYVSPVIMPNFLFQKAVEEVC